MNIDQVSRDLVSKHWGAVDFDKLIAAEMRNLREETIEECAAKLDWQGFPGAFALRSMKHPPTQPDAQTEQPMHMQNGLTLEQREWIRAEIACALESRPAAPTPKADEMLRAVVEAASGANRSLFNEDSWSTSVYRRYSRALSAAREYVQNKAGTDARESSSGEAGSMDVPIKPCSTTAADAPQDGASASIPAPSSREVEAQGKAKADIRCIHGVSIAERCAGCKAHAPASAMTQPTAPPPTTGEREVPADDAGWPAWFPTFEELNTAARKAHMDRRIGVPSNVAIIDAVAGLIAQRSPLSPEAKLTRVKVNRQYSAHGVRIVEVMSDASQRHVDSIYWGELLEEKRRFSPEAKTYAQGWRAACERIEAEAAHRAKLYDNGSDGERSFGQWMAANALAKFAYETIAACPTPPVDATSPEAKGEGTVRDLVRKIDELRERALRERSNTALLDFRAATFDAWPTIRAALTGGAL